MNFIKIISLVVSKILIQGKRQKILQSRWPTNFIEICILGIEDLCSKRDELHRQTILEEEEKNRIQNDIRVLTERLAKVNESLAKKMAQRNEFDKTIAETEAAYMKVCIA